MLRTYIYSKNNDAWIQEEHELLFHDICAILDENSKKIFVWNGPKSTKDTVLKASQTLDKIFSIHKDYDVITLKNKIPSYIKEKLADLLETVEREDKSEYFEFSHFLTIRLYFIGLIFTLILLISCLINLWSAIIWPSTNNNYFVIAGNYDNWLKISSNLLIASICFICFIFIISIYEYEVQAIILSLIGLIISIGILIFLQQGIFIFLFQPGSNSSLYLISEGDLLFFLVILTNSIAIYEIPSIIKLLYFLKTYKQFIF